MMIMVTVEFDMTRGTLRTDCHCLDVLITLVENITGADHFEVDALFLFLLLVNEQSVTLKEWK